MTWHVTHVRGGSTVNCSTLTYVIRLVTAAQAVAVDLILRMDVNSSRVRMRGGGQLRKLRRRQSAAENRCQRDRREAGRVEVPSNLKGGLTSSARAWCQQQGRSVTFLRRQRARFPDDEVQTQPTADSAPRWRIFEVAMTRDMSASTRRCLQREGPAAVIRAAGRECWGRTTAAVGIVLPLAYRGQEPQVDRSMKRAVAEIGPWSPPLQAREAVRTRMFGDLTMNGLRPVCAGEWSTRPARPVN